jgi:hypothetical protein
MAQGLAYLLSLARCIFGDFDAKSVDIDSGANQQDQERPDDEKRVQDEGNHLERRN